MTRLERLNALRWAALWHTMAAEPGTHARRAWKQLARHLGDLHIMAALGTLDVGAVLFGLGLLSLAASLVTGGSQ